jgi:RNA-directed DNA polymerase
MRLPHQLLKSLCFTFTTAQEFVDAMGPDIVEEERRLILHLAAIGIPPITSRSALATMLGVNPGLIWSIENNSSKYYREFEIKSGRKVRRIAAPKIALKVIQKWIGYHIARAVSCEPHVYGFIPGRSHIDAACVHRGAAWAFSVDIENFFESTPASLVIKNLRRIGYEEGGAILISSLCCRSNKLPQGAPSSPALSNLCFSEMDLILTEIAEKYSCKLTRYADDIVFSGAGTLPMGLRDDVYRLFENSQWRLAAGKEHRQPIKGRVKVHGLLVSGKNVRLTKGYRNKIRAYRHILAKRGDNAKDKLRLIGHLNFARQVDLASVMSSKDDSLN